MASDLRHRVEVVRSLSNPLHPAARLIANSRVPSLAEPIVERPTPEHRPERVQHWLEPDEVAELVATYQAGATIDELAARFSVHRTTVMAHLDRSGVARRQRGLAPEQVEEAAQLYLGGWSLVRVGDHFQVDAETVRQSLMSVGCPIRPRPGWARSTPPSSEASGAGSGEAAETGDVPR